MFNKLLVANRGEIAVRAFRAAYELGVATAAIYAPEDRGSVHRVKADESHEIGESGHPVRAYLDIDLIVGLAARIGADATHPGYGFLSENPELARRCAEAGIAFVGPPRRRAGAGGQQGARTQRGAARRSARPRRVGTPRRPIRRDRRRDRDALSTIRQSGGRRRRTGNATGPPT